MSFWQMPFEFYIDLHLVLDWGACGPLGCEPAKLGFSQTCEDSNLRMAGSKLAALSNKIIEKGLDFLCAKSVTVAARRAA
jgi:hypothetical protein